MSLPLELQIEKVSIFFEDVERIITMGETTWDELHFFTTQTLNTSSVTLADKKKLIDTATNFKRKMAFAQALRTFNFMKAKELLDAITKYENDWMEKQLFEKDKSESMVVMQCNGKINEYKGADEVARQFGESMKSEVEFMHILFNNAKFVQENCPLGLMMV